jgi:hypothetical protein
LCSRAPRTRMEAFSSDIRKGSETPRETAGDSLM